MEGCQTGNKTAETGETSDVAILDACRYWLFNGLALPHRQTKIKGQYG
jgi:hypothetical protein